MVNRSFRSLTAISASLLALGVAVATPVVMRGEDALQLAAQMVERGQYEKAEDILRTLATGDPETFDMRQIDRLAGKIAFARKDYDEALLYLRAVAKASPDEWRVHYDLAHVAMAAGHDREAERVLRRILSMPIDKAVAAKVRQDLRDIAERRVVHVTVRASAAPSTNINTATTAETFKFAGVIPFELSDDARAQSGLGMNWSLGGRLTPRLKDRLKGHLAINGTMSDYGHRHFDQTTAQLEAGFRYRMGAPIGGLDTTLVATTGHQGLAGDDYSRSVGGRLSVRSILSPKAAMGISLSMEDVDYTARDDRDGLVTTLSVSGQYLLNRRLRLGGGISLAREEANVKTEANTQTIVSAGAQIAAPKGLRLGIQPAIYHRQYDDVAYAYGTKRRDVTTDLSLSIGHNRVVIAGFRPAFVYRYTHNNSTVELFSYNRHAVDISLAKVF